MANSEIVQQICHGGYLTGVYARDEQVTILSNGTFFCPVYNENLHACTHYLNVPLYVMDIAATDLPATVIHPEYRKKIPLCRVYSQLQSPGQIIDA